MTELDNHKENTQEEEQLQEEQPVTITETVTLLFEFEFDDFKEIFSTLQKMTDAGIAYKVIVAETRETGFPVLELSGDRAVVESFLAEMGYSKDVLEIDEPVIDESEFDGQQGSDPGVDRF